MSLPPPAPSDDAYSSAVSELSTLISSSSPSLKSHNSASLISTASILSSLTSSHVTIITHVPPIPPYAPLPHVLLASFALARCLVHLGHRCTIITDESYEDQVMAGVIGIGEWAAAGRLTLESFPPGSECGEDEAQRLVELSENCCDHVVVIDASNGDISPIFAAVRSHNPAVGFTSISTDDDLEDNANIKCSFAHDVSSAGYALAAATALCIKTDSEGGAMSPAEIITACLPSPAAETELLRRLLPEPDLSPVSVLEKVISIVVPTEPTSSTTLDPTTSEEWAALRASSHALLDAALDKMEAAKVGRVWNPVPDSMKQSLNAPLPSAGISHPELAAKLETLLPHGVGNTHPRFFGWVHGAGAPGAVLPELVGAAMNANCGGRDHGGIYVERQVLAWSREIMGFPPDSGALLVSGTSMATVIAIKAARDRRLGFTESRTRGLTGVDGGGKLVGYMAKGAHSCLLRAFDILGLGSDALRLVPVKEDFTMDLDALKTAVATDRAAGLTPFVVVGTCGSVNVGAVDDMDALADYASSEGIWFHVDGAFGATAALSPALSPLLKGMDRADSLAFDFHKWLHVNYDAGCVLVRDGDAHLRAFSERPDYLAPSDRGLAAGAHWPVDYGPELSRGFRALKVWSHLTEHGTEKLGAAITRNVEQAAYLAGRVDASPSLRRLAPAAMQIVVFRYEGGAEGDGVPEEEMDRLNDLIVVELQERGIAAPSTTKIEGKLAIRVNITNHRTRFEDLDLLVAEVEKLGKELSDNN